MCKALDVPVYTKTLAPATNLVLKSNETQVCVLCFIDHIEFQYNTTKLVVVMS